LWRQVSPIWGLCLILTEPYNTGFKLQLGISMYGGKNVLALNDGTYSQHRLTGYKKGTLIIWDTQKMAEFIRK
jgi:hypothetical protein